MLDGGGGGRPRCSTGWNRTAPLVASGLMRVAGQGRLPVRRRGAGRRKACCSAGPSICRRRPARIWSRSTREWDDLVLPPSGAGEPARFHRLDPASRRGDRADWGARPLGGPLALFCGPSGSGKSFAAAIVAAELIRRTGENLGALRARSRPHHVEIRRRDGAEPECAARRARRPPRHSPDRRGGRPSRQARRGHRRARPLRQSGSLAHAVALRAA